MARILLIEDDRDQADIRTLLLERAGHSIWVAESVSAVSRGLDDADPQLILMDLCLPRPEDGLALIGELRANHPSARIVVLSGLGKGEAMLSETAKVDRFLAKPVGTKKLLDVISELVTE